MNSKKRERISLNSNSDFFVKNCIAMAITDTSGIKSRIGFVYVVTERVV